VAQRDAHDLSVDHVAGEFGGLADGKILEDLAEVHRRIPRERMRYALEIPYNGREKQQRRDPRPQKALGTRCRMTARGPAREQPPMLQAAPEHPDLPPQSARILAAQPAPDWAGLCA
jgi:hypothetical protein